MLHRFNFYFGDFVSHDRLEWACPDNWSRRREAHPQRAFQFPRQLGLETFAAQEFEGKPS